MTLVRHCMATRCTCEDAKSWLACPFNSLLFSITILMEKSFPIKSNMCKSLKRIEHFGQFCATFFCKLLFLSSLAHLRWVLNFLLPAWLIHRRLKPYFQNHIFKTRSSFNTINVSHILTFQQKNFKEILNVIWFEPRYILRCFLKFCCYAKQQRNSDAIKAALSVLLKLIWSWRFSCLVTGWVFPKPPGTRCLRGHQQTLALASWNMCPTASVQVREDCAQ